MLEDREQELLLEIERRLVLEDPGLVRAFGALPDRRSVVPRRGTDAAATVAGLTLCLVLLIGPRALTDAEIVTRVSRVPLRPATATA